MLVAINRNPRGVGCWALIVHLMYSDTLNNGFHVAPGVPGAFLYSGTHLCMAKQTTTLVVIPIFFISRLRESIPLPRLILTDTHR
jgi:hypothetical protein